ncbi:MAG TPA: hypothetical protein VFN30_07785 [Chitinophagaceae bacterium]|nr:hypothetical protein [Chitinophagaceae bacterium]
MTDINLWLDSYDDIYSDFDSRQYMKRRVSEDFLHELRSEMKYKGHRADNIMLLLPSEKRNENIEKIIRASISNFLNNQFQSQQEKCRKKLYSGVSLLIAGIIVILTNSWINYLAHPSFIITTLRVLLEPAGWFLLWAALDFLFYDLGNLKKEKEFYKKISKMYINFKSS